MDNWEERCKAAEARVTELEAEVERLRARVAELDEEANKYRVFWQASQQEIAALAGTGQNTR